MGEPAEDRGDDLAPDAALAEDLGDEEARRAEQYKYYGGDLDEEEEPLDNLDRGDSLEEDGGQEEAQDESEDSSDEADGEESEAEDDADGDSGVDSDEEDEAEDDDDEDSEDAAESDDDDDVEPEDTPKDTQRVPLSRFNEVNERMKAAERRLAELEGQQQAVEQATEAVYDFQEAEEAYTELLLEGDTKGAAAKRLEIRAAEKAENEAAAAKVSHDTVEQQAELRELTDLTNQAASMYPVFDESHKDFNPNMVTKVATFMRGYSAENLHPTDAFVAALADTIDLFDLDTKYGETETPNPEPTVKKGKSIKKTKEKLEVAQKQGKTPANQGRGSADAGAAVPDIEKMSDAELDALPEETLARLRGDYVE